ncbi:hypothetical protein ARMGADRAFT_1031991 [Armillaria gallica]|uniref:Uncharacterized protein n=1 Tax=Armillaria gallica TaxID=47427 RepID=A0A2H3DRJ8_ARMGA|nr:hypothetical protein ARMGADRAFT_1031991 [Armillaria gallica]
MSSPIAVDTPLAVTATYATAVVTSHHQAASPGITATHPHAGTQFYDIPPKVIHTTNMTCLNCWYMVVCERFIGCLSFTANSATLGASGGLQQMYCNQQEVVNAFNDAVKDSDSELPAACAESAIEHPRPDSLFCADISQNLNQTDTADAVNSKVSMQAQALKKHCCQGCKYYVIFLRRYIGVTGDWDECECWTSGISEVVFCLYLTLRDAQDAYNYALAQGWVWSHHSGAITTIHAATVSLL